MSRYIGNDPVFCMNPLETRQWRLHQGNEVQQIVVRHYELNQRLLNRWTLQLDLECMTGGLERVVSVHNST